jgi:D-sedoheptulose 7-phosphate isomerase
MISKYLAEVNMAIADLDVSKILTIIEVLTELRSNKRWLFTFGNGGSGSTASHFAGDLSKACGFKAVCLNDSMPSITAWSNDVDYRVVFQKQLERLSNRGDAVFAISGSGNSPNVIRGLQMAKAKGVFTIGLTAFDGGMLKSVAELSVVVPVKNMEVAEDLHLIICHVIKTALVMK